MKETIKWIEYTDNCIPIEDNYNDRDVLCKWEDGSITTESIKYERIIGDARRKYAGHITTIIKPKYFAEIK